MTDSELFSQTIENQESDTVLGQPSESKYANWTVEALVKKAEAADNHITTLESEAKLYRKSEQDENALREVLSKLDHLNKPSGMESPSFGVNNPPLSQPNPGDTVTKDDVLNMVKTSLEQTQKQTLAKNNVEKVRTELKKAWGDNYQNILTQKVRDLGVDQSYLESTAEQYPDAFLRLVLGQNDKSTSNPNIHVPPTSSTSAPAHNVSGSETYKDFKAQYKANPALLADPAFNKRMHEAAQRLGDAFYK